MGKQADKRIDLARRVLETTDKTVLDAIEIALLGRAPARFTRKELAEMEAIADRVERGDEKGRSWPAVKREALRRARR